MRPFLAAVEKLWIVRQVLAALDQMHSRGVRHGDLTELDLNRAMCYELKTLLENHGASVQMFEYPRGSRNAPWLPERGRRAKGLSLIHI